MNCTNHINTESEKWLFDSGYIHKNRWDYVKYFGAMGDEDNCIEIECVIYSIKDIIVFIHKNVDRGVAAVELNRLSEAGFGIVRVDRQVKMEYNEYLEKCREVDVEPFSEDEFGEIISTNIEGDIDIVTETQLWALGYCYEITTGVTERLYSKTFGEDKAIWLDSVDALKNITVGIEGDLEEKTVNEEIEKLKEIGFKIDSIYNRD